MQKFKDALREEQKRLEEIIAKAKKENEHMPEGNLRISKQRKDEMAAKSPDRLMPGLSCMSDLIRI